MKEQEYAYLINYDNYQNNNNNKSNNLKTLIKKE
jgi:hypothetical protein